jgi:hypothetical protein
MNQAHFKLCSTCKTPIAFAADYFRCSVSTCNRKRTELYFCSVPCWDAHVPGARHRDAWAEPTRAPSQGEYEAANAREETPPPERARRVVTSPGKDDLPRDVLVVVSKVKGYIRAYSGMNTSDNVTRVLSDHLRELCRAATNHARDDERKTVLDRDFEAVLSRR